MKSMKVVLCYSGGLDSTVLLWDLRAQGHEVLPLAVHYGQRHERELQSACEIADPLIVSIGGLLLAGSLTSEEEVPDGHYADPTMKRTVVPNRNMMLLSIATAYAISEGAGAVAFAAHGGDHAIYPDCRPPFVAMMGQAIQEGNYEAPFLMAPYLERSKNYLVSLGSRLGAPLADTWSCYRGGEFHCGTCGTCHERKEAFLLARVADPTKYKG